MSHKDSMTPEQHENAVRIYEAAKAAGCEFNDSWSPESYERDCQRGRPCAEFITVMDPTDEQRKVLSDLGFIGAMTNSWPGICVVKHGDWPVDVYNRASGQDKAKMDAAFEEMVRW